MAHTMRRDPFAQVSTSASVTGEASVPGAGRAARAFSPTSGSGTTGRTPRRPTIAGPSRFVRSIGLPPSTHDD